MLDSLAGLAENLVDLLEPAPQAPPPEEPHAEGAAAASSTEGPPPPPADGGSTASQPAMGMADGGRRLGATVTLQCPGGSISHYPSKQAFEAVCCNKAHGRCVATRTQRGKRKGADGWPATGRPCGFLAAWLAAGESLATKEEHWAPGVLAQPLAVRVDLRRQIAESGEAGRLLLQQERAKEPAEPEEPESLAGYLR